MINDLILTLCFLKVCLKSLSKIIMLMKIEIKLFEVLC